MNLLLKAALRNRRHFTLLIMTFTTLFVLTIANQLEMFSLGILANTGSDFFTLFSPEKNAVVSGLFDRCPKPVGNDRHHRHRSDHQARCVRLYRAAKSGQPASTWRFTMLKKIFS